jgi:hypothetical protein
MEHFQTYLNTFKNAAKNERFKDIRDKIIQMKIEW